MNGHGKKSGSGKIKKKLIVRIPVRGYRPFFLCQPAEESPVVTDQKQTAGALGQG
jgi:hypothetical protein